jgi:hypothetical protein
MFYVAVMDSRPNRFDFCLLGEGIDPFKSIMEAPAKEAEQILEQAEAVGRKFRSDYVQYRRRAEAWLKAEGEAKGLQPEAAHPLYFRLHTEPSTTLRTPGTTLVNIPATHIPTAVMTFTYDDSFHNFLQLTGRPSEHTPPDLQPGVFNAEGVSIGLIRKAFRQSTMAGTAAVILKGKYGPGG